jgi:hypothetical protein
MGTDILDDLKGWLAQLVADKTHRERGGGLPEIEIGYVRRAIEEIERLRAAAKMETQSSIFVSHRRGAQQAPRRASLRVAVTIRPTEMRG